MTESITPDGVAAVLAAGTTAAAGPRDLNPGERGAVVRVVPAGWEVEVAEYDLDHLADAPRRIKTRVSLAGIDAFVDYLDRFHTPGETVVFADVTGSSDRVTAIIDYHGPGVPSWASHRAVYDLVNTEEWAKWTGSAGRQMRQTEFAEFIENGLAQVVRPSGADMLAIVQSLSGSRNVSWESGTRTTDGMVRMRYVEDGTAAATNATKQAVEIPESFDVLLRPWRGSDIAVTVTARFRYRIQPGGQVAMWYDLPGIEAAEEAACLAFVADLRERVDAVSEEIPVYLGAGDNR